MNKPLFLLYIIILLSIGTLGQVVLNDATAGVKSQKKEYSGVSKQQGEAQIPNAVTSFYGDIAWNAFVQPYYKTNQVFNLNYYGSGSTNGDTIIDWTDCNTILSNQSDRTDIDGNGVTNSEDKTMLQQYLLDEIPYLPAHWDLLQTRNERISWLQNAVAIDQTQIPKPGWICSTYAMQFLINMCGVENISGSGMNFSIYDTTTNARFNIPVYKVGTVAMNPPGTAHAINGVMTGDSIVTFNNGWYFIEPQNDQRVLPGSVSMDPDSYVRIRRYAYVWSEVLQQFVWATSYLIDFELLAGQVDSVYVYPLPETVYYRTIANVNLQGTKPANTVVNWINGQASTSPSYTGWPTGVSPGGTLMEYADSSNQASGNWDPDHYNFTIWRNWILRSPTHSLVDTTLAHTWSIYNRPAQQITVQDTASPVFVYVPSGPILFTEYEANGIPDSQGNDNCGVFEITRTTDSTNRVMDSTQCEYYEFTEWFSDHIEDPTGNFDDSSSSVNVDLNPSIFSFVPPTYTANYGDPLDPLNTGGYATATNPAGVTVNISYNDSTTQLSDTTQCGHFTYELWRKWWAVTEPCQDSIWALQLINVQEIEPPILTYVPPDTVVPIGGNIHPDYLGWSEGEDPVSGVPPTPDYYDEVIYQGTDSIYIGRHHWVVDICLTASDEDMQYITQMVMIGDDELGDGKLFVVYPNPVEDKLYIRFANAHNISIVKLCNLIGHTQITIQVGEHQNLASVDVSMLPNGIYMITFYSGEMLIGVEKVILID